MPAFTTPLYKAIEQAGDSGLNLYPIFDESYRPYLNQRILEHYDEQEIGFESPHRFVFALQRRMFEIMPKYNQLYESQKLVIDPLNTVNMKTVFDSENNSTNTQHVKADGVTDSKQDSTLASVSTGNSDTTTHEDGDVDVTGTNKSDVTTHDDNATDTTTDNRARTTNSAMPQGRLGGDKDYATSGSDVVSGVDTHIDSVTNGTSGTVGSDTQKTVSVNDGTSGTVTSDTNDVTSNDTGNTVSSNTTDGTGTSKDTLHTENTELGWSGSQAELLLKYRQTFMNIDLMIINELSDLFMLLWNTSDDYENNYDMGMFGYGY